MTEGNRQSATFTREPADGTIALASTGSIRGEKAVTLVLTPATSIAGKARIGSLAKAVRSTEVCDDFKCIFCSFFSKEISHFSLIHMYHVILLSLSMNQ